jgi:hypothetical protein
MRTPLQVVDTQPKAKVEGEEPRRASVAGQAGEIETSLSTAVGREDYFDIPAFLRRQAD